MKNKSLLLLLFAACATLGAQPDTDISFVRGLGNTCAWDETAAAIDAALDAFATLDPLSNTNNPIETQNIRFQGRENVVVGHSMGGLVARSEIVEGDNFDHLISIGTPHLGAPIAAQGSNAGTLVTWWIQDILAGPCAEFGGAWCFADNWIVDVLGLTVFPFLVQELSPLGEPSTNQMIPGSAFMNTLNGNFAASLPAPLNANRFIFGVEDWQHHYRVLQSTTSDCEPENGAVAGVATFLGNIYLIVSLNHFFNAVQYLNLFFQTFDFWYLIQFFNEMYLFQAWYQGAYSLLELQQLEWSAYIDGSYLGPNNYWTSDGVVPTYSQAAVTFMPPENTAFSLGCNHNEETMHPNAVAAINNALAQLGIF